MNVETHEHYVVWLLIDFVAHMTEEKKKKYYSNIISISSLKFKLKCLPLDLGLKR